MKQPTISRTVLGYTHVLNCTTGNIVSLEASQSDVDEFMANLSCSDSDCDEELRQFFLSGSGQDIYPNTRLCRENFVRLGMKFNFPTIVNIELNTRCSLRCQHCYLSDVSLQTKEKSLFERMSESEIRKLLSSLKTMGVFCLVLTGGEPFLNRNIELFAKIATEMGFVLEIFSNLQKIPEWVLRSDADQLRIGRFQTSVYSVSEYAHDGVTRKSGSLQKTLNNIFALKERRWCVEVATPLMKLNFLDRLETQAFFRQKGVPQDFSWPIVNEYCNRPSAKSDLNISSDQFAEFVSANPDFIIETDTGDKSTYICEAGRATFSITAHGDVYPCSQFPMKVGNIAEYDIEAIFASSTMKRVACFTNGQIGQDKTYNYCPGVNYSETGNPFQEPDYVLVSIGGAIRR